MEEKKLDLKEKAKTCEHFNIETLFQYDRKKNREIFWACSECRMKFYPADKRFDGYDKSS